MTRASIYYTHLHFHCSFFFKNKSCLTILILPRTRESIRFNRHTGICGQMSDEELNNLIIMLDKKCKFSKNILTFTDIVTYL